MIVIRYSIILLLESHLHYKPSAQSSALENFFQNTHTHAGSLVNTILPACYIYHFALHFLKPSAQNPFRAEDFCSIIIETCLYKATESPQISQRSPRFLFYVLRYFLKVGTFRAQYSECVPSHSFTPNLQVAFPIPKVY